MTTQPPEFTPRSKERGFSSDRVMTTNEEQAQREQDLRFHQFPLECVWGGYSDDDDFCCEWLHGEKEFYVIEVQREFMPEAQRKGKWYVYRGFCKIHFKDALKREKYGARWHNGNKLTKNPQKVKIAHVWKITEVKV